MAKKSITIAGADADRLHAEIGKVRAWLSGFAAARPGTLNNTPPGADSLRQIQQLLKP